jgi:ribosomal protein S18 acetylase RimI-like enzyme
MRPERSNAEAEVLKTLTRSGKNGLILRRPAMIRPASKSEADFEIHPLTAEYRPWADNLIEQHWGSVKIVTRGRVHDVSTLPGFVAVKDGNPTALVTYRIEGDQCEMVSLDSLIEGLGIGTALIDAVRRTAVEARCKRLWLITTNDNLAAVRFYQKSGFHLAALHRDALAETRRLKPSLPERGIDGIPLRDEIELELILEPGTSADPG